MTNGSKIAVSWIEIVLVILLTTLGMSFWVNAERRTRALAGSEPRAEDFAQKYGVPEGQRRSSLAEAEWKAHVALLVEQRLDVLRQAAKLRSLESSYPGLRATQSVPPASAVPPEEVKEYRDAQRQLKTATLMVESLTVSLREIEARLDRSATALRLAQHHANRDWREVRAHQKRARQGWTLLLAGGGSCLALLLTFLALSGSTARRLGIQRGLIFGGTAALLSILYGYQIFQGLSLAAASLLLLASLGLTLRSSPADSNATGGTP
jgi:hypothetical protein